MKTLPLSRGYVAVVDDDDYVWASQWKWTLTTKRDAKIPRRYAYRLDPLPNGKKKNVMLHRAIMMRHGFEIDGLYVDHIDIDGLNNRKENLRVVTNSNNMGNGRVRVGRFKGVRSGRNGKFVASITVNYKGKALGVFDCEEDAARAYDAAARIAFGECARLNFPQPGERAASDMDA